MLRYCSTCHTVLGCRCESPDTKEVACDEVKGAIWAHVLDQDGEALAGVEVTVTTQAAKASGGNGFAQFPNLNDATYTVSIREEGNEDIAEDYVLPTAEVSVTLSGGQVAYVDFHATKKGEIVATAQLGEVKLQDVPFKISGEEVDPVATSEEGKANLGKRAPNDYTVTIAGEKHAGSFDPAQKPVTVVSGGVAEVVFDATAKVKATVVTDDNVGWFHAETAKRKRIKLTLTVEETLFGDPCEHYDGAIELVAVELTLFDSEDAAEARAEPLTLLDLRAGKDLWAMGPVGARSFTFTLAAVEGFAITQADEVALEIKQVNVITARIRSDELVLVHSNHHARATDISRMIVDYVQTNDTHACPDLTVTLDYDNSIACFLDAGCTQPLDTGTAIAAGDMPLDVYMRGAAAGDCDLRATPGGTADPAWDFAPAVTKTIRVESLELVADEFNAGLTLGADNPLGAPKLRELHKRSGTTFTFARITVTAPSATFWQKADRVELLHANLDLFDDALAAHAGADTVQQGDFAAAVVRYVAAQGAPAVDNIPAHGHGIPAARAPVKVVTDRYVSCGARLQAAATYNNTQRTLRHGDVVRLDTFSFDQHIDRLVGNECRNRINVVGFNASDVALALTAAHKYYDHRSAFWVNHNYAAGFFPFTDFIASMNDPHGNNNTWATAGANYVRDFLATEHGIVLHATMRTRIRNHIFAVISGARVIPNANQDRYGNFVQHYGFSALYGVPGVHAECLAANELINAGILPADITVATYMLQAQNNRQGRPFVACPNCNGILVAPGGFRVITG